MAVEKVREFLKENNMEDRLIEFSESIATVAMAAKEIGCKEGDIVKTMAFMVEDRPIAIGIAGDYKIINRKFKDYFKVKAKMIPGEILEETVGHEPGGVCPFALNEKVTFYLDESLKNLDTMYPAGGSLNSAVKLNLEELIKLTGNPTWVDISELAVKE